jgi:methyl-accepting chemotaxis protein
VLAVLALGVLHLGQLSAVKDTKERTGKQTAPHAVALSAAAIAAKSAADAERGFLLTGATTFEQEIAASVAKADAALDAAQKTAPAPANAEAVVRTGFDHWSSARDQWAFHQQHEGSAVRGALGVYGDERALGTSAS